MNDIQKAGMEFLRGIVEGLSVRREAVIFDNLINLDFVAPIHNTEIKTVDEVVAESSDSFETPKELPVTSDAQADDKQDDNVIVHPMAGEVRGNLFMADDARRQLDDVFGKRAA
jgi:hypothetical protein